ncbi:MAG TPA: NAD(P)-binding protein [Candidatus Dormibacteraeota bacterium]|nr:NAD(P)-binding protein [Candidatus Dormibacteraeota bacterium]
MKKKAPIKVAIVGGGCAAMTCAFELTRPELRGRYAVTVYQVGWRLGGKGASGRGAAARIEEHGLHLWMGFYENAFRLMRECYGELDRDPRTCPIATWRDAFSPAPYVGVAEQGPDGRWVSWAADLPPIEGLPGEAPDAQPRWTVNDYVGRVVGLLRALLSSLPGAAGQTAPDGAATADAVNARVAQLLKFGELATLTALIEGVELLQTMLGDLTSYSDNLVLRVLDALAANARTLIEARAAVDLEVRRVWTIVDLTLATLRGIVRFRLATDPRGFDAIDDYDCREFLRLNGASELSLASGYLRGLYDLGFSYQDGNPETPRIAAGQALRSMVRAFFTYRGSFFWRMNAGMGDIVFAPLYEVLRRRGVRFAFFHRLEQLRLSPAGDGEAPHVAALEFDVQAEIRAGGEYQPLVDVGGLPCWPSEPVWEQLADGERLRAAGVAFESFWDRRALRRTTLRVGADFDLAVLAVGLGAVPHVARELVERDPRWRAMVDHVQSVATQAFQVWLTEDMGTLGWTAPPINLSGFVEPFDTWADMRHLLAHERWPEPVRSLAYFCSVLPDARGAGDRGDGEYPARAREHVRANAVTFLERDVGHLWPRAAAPGGGFRWELLADAQGGAGADAGRFGSQFWTANVNPSDRYVLSLPGSSAYRISPLDDSYDNLTIAGDWTACGFNAGCVEAAVMSGRLAAHALAESPPLADIVGYDHP